MDEAAAVFGKVAARSRTSAGTQPLDRISVRDYTRQVEIGAFRSERGKRQRIRFNVVLEVSRHTAARDDDVDKVISYDLIVEAIEAQLSTERINLLETLAERIAERCLDDRRVVTAHVRIEKLDRIPGALGVEIVRMRADGAKVLASVQPKPQEPAGAPHPVVILLPNSVLNGTDLERWIAAAAALNSPAIFCLEPIDPAEALGGTEAARRIGLLSIEQNAWKLAGMNDGVSVVDSRTELDWAMKHGHLCVWAPSKIINDAVEDPGVDATDPAGLAAWFAREFSARTLVLAGSEMSEPDMLAGLGA